MAQKGVVLARLKGWRQPAASRSSIQLKVFLC